MRQYLAPLLAAIAASVLTAFIVVPAMQPTPPVPPVPETASETPAAEVTPPHIPDLASLTEDERSALRGEVRAFLLDQPEVLMEAIQVLEARQNDAKAAIETQVIANNADEIYRDGYSWVGGNPDGDITLVEFMDYRCGYCRKAHDEVKELVESDGNIRLIIKEFPILGEQSTLSSRLAIATLHKAGPEAYHALADVLITFSGSLTDTVMEAMLTKLELDPAEILPYMDDPAVSGQIGKVHALAGVLEITGTPTFVLEGEMLRGYAPLDVMREIVAYHRSQKG